MINTLTYSPAAIAALTEASEGCVLSAYPDPATGAEPWTIGYGHTGQDVFDGLTCTQAQADAWLRADIATAQNAVNALTTVQLSQHEFDALVDFAYNCGIGNFASSTLLRMLNMADFEGADEQFARWVNGGGHRLPGLVARRALESNWFTIPDSPSDVTD